MKSQRASSFSSTSCKSSMVAIPASCKQEAQILVGQKYLSIIDPNSKNIVNKDQTTN